MVPDIQVFMGVDDDGCPGEAEESHLLPIRTRVNPNYNDWNPPSVPYFVPGCAGTDAIRKTYQTMDMFRDYGRNRSNG